MKNIFLSVLVNQNWKKVRTSALYCTIITTLSLSWFYSNYRFVKITIFDDDRTVIADICDCDPSKFRYFFFTYFYARAGSEGIFLSASYQKGNHSLKSVFFRLVSGILHEILFCLGILKTYIRRDEINNNISSHIQIRVNIFYFYYCRLLIDTNDRRAR